ncbi:hypothetical protein L596_027021 [Steinernema carpocapsae]|uniref:Uncharacterized protein n=1 Tax=Steinernema carpocapsae TaxID=34508 RepID=A0A4V5ZYC8_STECR|nr:hypothetical protein L596_027021 [Steinernema carpocapsae]
MSYRVKSYLPDYTENKEKYEIERLVTVEEMVKETFQSCGEEIKSEQRWALVLEQTPDGMVTPIPLSDFNLRSCNKDCTYIVLFQSSYVENGLQLGPSVKQLQPQPVARAHVGRSVTVSVHTTIRSSQTFEQFKVDALHDHQRPNVKNLAYSCRQKLRDNLCTIFDYRLRNTDGPIKLAVAVRASNDQKMREENTLSPNESYTIEFADPEDEDLSESDCHFILKFRRPEKKNLFSVTIIGTPAAETQPDIREKKIVELRMQKPTARNLAEQCARILHYKRPGETYNALVVGSDSQSIPENDSVSCDVFYHVNLCVPNHLGNPNLFTCKF